MIPWEQPIPECTECKYNEPPYHTCLACKMAFSDNKIIFFRQKEVK